MAKQEEAKAATDTSEKTKEVVETKEETSSEATQTARELYGQVVGAARAKPTTSAKKDEVKAGEGTVDETATKAAAKERPKDELDAMAAFKLTEEKLAALGDEGPGLLARLVKQRRDVAHALSDKATLKARVTQLEKKPKDKTKEDEEGEETEEVEEEEEAEVADGEDAGTVLAAIGKAAKGLKELGEDAEYAGKGGLLDEHNSLVRFVKSIVPVLNRVVSERDQAATGDVDKAVDGFLAGLDAGVYPELVIAGSIAELDEETPEAQAVAELLALAGGWRGAAAKLGKAKPLDHYLGAALRELYPDRAPKAEVKKTKAGEKPPTLTTRATSRAITTTDGDREAETRREDAHALYQEIVGKQKR